MVKGITLLLGLLGGGLYLSDGMSGFQERFENLWFDIKENTTWVMMGMVIFIFLGIFSRRFKRAF